MKVVSLIKSEIDLDKFNLIKAQDIKSKENSNKFENYEIGNDEFYVYGILNYIGDNTEYYLLKSGSVLATYNVRLFNIIDPRISKYWIIKKYEKGYKRVNKEYGEQFLKENLKIIGFLELVNDLDFLDNLSDWDEKEAEIFKKYEKLMYLEYPDNEIKDIGIILLEPNWIQCPKCDYVWQEKPIFGMLECENCNKIMHNPLYIDIFKDISFNSLSGEKYKTKISEEEKQERKKKGWEFID